MSNIKINIFANKSICPFCLGTGKDKTVKCKYCNGTGIKE